MPNAVFNKSLVTNLIAISLIMIGFTSISYAGHFLQTGLFALSGAITNWLAVHMLFERVPLLYGSGVIPNQFEHFRTAIKDLIMQQFFTRENIERFISEEMSKGSSQIDFTPVIDSVDYNQFFDSLVETIIQSSFGSMLGMIGGPSALEGLREPFQEKMRGTFHSISESDSFQDALSGQLDSSDFKDKLITNIEHIVINRLNELTPEMVKEIVHKMIRKHLGWLVVWGGVFGGLIGLIVSFTL